MPYYLQDDQDQREIAFDWSDRLDDVGSPQDTIATSTWSVTPDIGSPSETLTPQTTVGNVTSAILKDTVPGYVYVITNTITTAQGRTHNRSATVRCE